MLQELYLAHLGHSLISRLRSPEQWRYEMFGSHPESIWTLKLKIIQTSDDKIVGYVSYDPFGTAIEITELGVDVYKRQSSWCCCGARWPRGAWPC